MTDKLKVSLLGITTVSIGGRRHTITDSRSGFVDVNAPWVLQVIRDAEFWARRSGHFDEADEYRQVADYMDSGGVHLPLGGETEMAWRADFPGLAYFTAVAAAEP